MLECYPCRKVPLNYSDSLLFHGGNTDSIPVRDANSVGFKDSMRVTTFPLFAVLLCINSVAWASGQVGQEPGEKEQNAAQNPPKTPPDERSAESITPSRKDKPDEPPYGFTWSVADGCKLKI